MVSRYPVAGELVSLRDAMDKLMSDAFGGTFRSVFPTAQSGQTRMPLPLDIYATNEEVVIIAAVPGIDPANIEVTVDKGTVTLTGSTPDVAQSNEAAEATWLLHELPRGTFSRSITLPVEIDANNADATFEHGVLRLRLPKSEAAKPRKIEIRSVKADEVLDTESAPVAETSETAKA
ncbi:MAG TPA: Hsp20/alpha crystallin family protein [Thermomicrobiales bacterium]|nr:Hsp20/alpha crystallin family protein [Thermomicrobiales bacterium]